MRTAEFLAHLKSLQVRVWAEEGELRCSAPKGVLTADLRTELGSMFCQALVIVARTPHLR